jgi:hypothetical protein
MNETNELSVEQRIADLERYVSASSGTAATPATYRPVGAVLHIHTYSIPITLPGVLLFGSGLFVLICLGVLILKGSRRRRS